MATTTSNSTSMESSSIFSIKNENQKLTLAIVEKPNDVYYSKLNAILKEKGKPPEEDRREVPMPILRQCMEELIRETLADLLSRLAFSYSFLISSLFWFCIFSELWCSCPSVGLCYKNVQKYSRSLAIIHIDYNICFEKGKKLRVSEKVPYRLTQNLQNALGIAGLEGVF
ncbi:unnamed protein product [Rotaria sp. Silwood2]|nr:unnamed protein product [Rotaria sp. Silwood2]